MGLESFLTSGMPRLDQQLRFTAADKLFGQLPEDCTIP